MTAKEYIENLQSFGPNSWWSKPIDELMEEYAREYAKACLHRAAENATAGTVCIDPYDRDGYIAIVDKESITSEDNLI